MASGYAVVDVETTGLCWGATAGDRGDRIIEVAVVHVDTTGRITGAWDTLVNPGHDLGSAGPRRIRSSDVRLAPTFEQIAPELCALLEGRVVVAHNASFDARFLAAEFELAGLPTPVSVARSLCTMQLARHYLPGVGRSLADCGAALGMDLVESHRASADAWAAAELLGALVRRAPFDAHWLEAAHHANASRWPSPPATGFSWTPRPPGAGGAPSFLARLTVRLPGTGAAPEHVDYLALLDRALVDGLPSDGGALFVAAQQLGIGRRTRQGLHVDYYQQLVHAAWRRGAPAECDVVALLAVAELLDVDPGRVLEALTTAPATRG